MSLIPIKYNCSRGVRCLYFHFVWQILIDGKDPNAKDIDGCGLPTLVYLAREKRPQHPHHFKAGAMNALVTNLSACTHILFVRFWSRLFVKIIYLPFFGLLCRLECHQRSAMDRLFSILTVICTQTIHYPFTMHFASSWMKRKAMKLLLYNTHNTSKILPRMMYIATLYEWLSM